MVDALGITKLLAQGERDAEEGALTFHEEAIASVLESIRAT